jgi:hypothetical protein
MEVDMVAVMRTLERVPNHSMVVLDLDLSKLDSDHQVLIPMLIPIHLEVDMVEYRKLLI